MEIDNDTVQKRWAAALRAIGPYFMRKKIPFVSGTPGERRERSFII